MLRTPGDRRPYHVGAIGIRGFGGSVYAQGLRRDKRDGCPQPSVVIWLHVADVEGLSGDDGISAVPDEASCVFCYHVGGVVFLGL
jgi:hypothetical protein